jgi:hypothetical protein
MRFLVPVVFLAVILFALLAMKTLPNESVRTLPNESVRTLPNESVSTQTYLFIETQKHKNGTIINGTPSSLFIDAPTYDLRNSTLRTVERIELNSSTKAIYGNKFQISGDIGSGISSRLYPIRYLPYNYGEINILKIEGYNVTLDCYGKNATLMPGNSYKRRTTQPETIGERLLNVTTTVTVYNHGKVAVKVERWLVVGREGEALKLE